MNVDLTYQKKDIVAIEKKIVASVSSVTVSKNNAITLLPANADRVGYSLFNNSSQDVVIRYYSASADNDLNGFALRAGETRYVNQATYIGEISSIRLTTTGGQTSEVKITEW